MYYEVSGDRVFDRAHLLGILNELNSPRGLQASLDTLFRDAVFGRDSLRVGLDLFGVLPNLAEQIIFCLAAIQSNSRDVISDAKGPGQIPHEFRFLFNGPKMINRRQQQIFAELSRQWGGSATEVIQYGSADATPQFVRLVAQYCQKYGVDLLDRVLLSHWGERRTIRQQVIRAVTWTSDQILHNPLGLLGFRRSNVQFGHRYQILQDGATALIHADGRLANTSEIIETIGLQGLAYDCLIYGVELVGKDVGKSAEIWQGQASNLARSVMELYWNRDLQYFHSVLDRNPHTGAPQLSTVLDAMPGELLETRIFESLGEEQRREAISGIIRQLFSSEFLTPAGIRTRGVSYAELLPYADYHGSQTCWGVINSVIANGLRTQNFNVLADEVAARYVGALSVSGELYEFLYVSPEGQVAYEYTGKDDCDGMENLIVGTNRPQRDQAWTVSFVLREAELKRPGTVGNIDRPERWKTELTREISEGEASADTLRMTEKLRHTGISADLAYCVDTKKGAELERLVTDSR